MDPGKVKQGTGRQPRNQQHLESSTTPRLEEQREEVVLLAPKDWDHMVGNRTIEGYIK